MPKEAITWNRKVPLPVGWLSEHGLLQAAGVLLGFAVEPGSVTECGVCVFLIQIQESCCGRITSSSPWPSFWSLGSNRGSLITA